MLAGEKEELPRNGDRHGTYHVMSEGWNGVQEEQSKESRKGREKKKKKKKKRVTADRKG